MSDPSRRKRIEEIKEKLRKQQENEEDVGTIQETEVHQGIVSEYDSHMRAAASMPVESYEMKDFEEFDPFDKAQSVLESKKDWSDLEPGQRAAYKLKRYDLKTDLKAVYDSALETLKEFYTNFSAQTAIKLIELAYNLRGEDGEPLFSDVPPELILTSGEKELDDFNSTSLQSAYTTVPLKLVKDKNDHENTFMYKTIMSLSFLAGSLIRTVTRSTSNYFKAREAIHKGFKQFYSYDIAVDSYPVSEALIASFKSCVTNNETIKHTLYTFFYTGEECPAGENIKDFMYRTHTRFTGFHVYNLFTRGAEVYNVSLKQFAVYLNSTLFHNTLVSLAEFFKSCAANNDEAHKLKMWRYARIFDQKFFVPLQTKKCVHFVAVLAFMMKIHDPEVNKRSGDVLQITQILNMSDAAKSFACLYAIRAHFVLTDVQLSGNYRNLLAAAYRREQLQ